MNNFFEGNNKAGGSGFIEFVGFKSGGSSMLLSQANTYVGAGMSSDNSIAIRLSYNTNTFTSINDYISPTLKIGVYSNSSKLQSVTIIGSVIKSKKPYDLLDNVNIELIGEVFP